MQISRSTVQYQRKPDQNGWLRKRLRDLASQRRRYGSPRLQVLLRREGKIFNHKRVERIYAEEGLQLKKTQTPSADGCAANCIACADKTARALEHGFCF